MNKFSSKSGAVNVFYLVLGLVVIGGLVGYYAFFRKTGESQNVTLSSPNRTAEKTAALGDAVATWQTYQNKSFGVEVKYPSEIFSPPFDNPSSKTISIIDKRFADQKNVSIASIPNRFFLDLSYSKSLKDEIDSERTSFADPKNPVMIVNAKDVTVSGHPAIRVIVGLKTTKQPTGYFTVAELPKPVKILAPSDTQIKPSSGSPAPEKYVTYNLISFGGVTENKAVVDKMVESVKFLTP